MIRKIIEEVTRRDLEIRERCFRMVILMGSFLAFFSIWECLICEEVTVVMVPLVILLGAFLVSLVLTFKYRRIQAAANILGIFILLIVFPEMFLYNNAVNGGASVWFILGLIYVFLMFEGKRMIFFLCLGILSTVASYGYAYFYPEAVVPLPSRGTIYFDSLFGVLLVSLAIGLIMKFQFRVFSMERDVAQKQKEELEVISNSKNSFFANMSHEIRTPINTILGLNEMILRESNEEGIREYAQDIQNASKVLLSLVNDILDLSQMEMKKMQIIPMEYQTREMFRTVITILQVRMNAKKLDFIVDIDEDLPTALLGDSKRIQQVLINILTNAVKYTEEGSVTLRVEAVPAAEDEIQLKMTVIDTGIGIRKEEIEYLYDSFRRVDQKKTQKIEGSGLGLSITKQLVDMMGGEISVDSIYTKGSTFTVVIPQKIVDARPLGDIKLREDVAFQNRNFYQHSFEAPEARILIVDDNEMNSMVARKLLGETKMQIDVANSGEQCLELTKRKYYHVILMDYMMPHMNGVETLHKLRKQENGLCQESAVLVLTANTLSENSELSRDNQFDGFLEKPLQGSILEEEILRFLPDDIIEYQRTQGSDSEIIIQHIDKAKRHKVYITTDCVCDLPKELLDKYDIGLIHLYIKTDRGRFADTKEIDSDDLTEYLRNPEITVQSESASVEEYENFFASILENAEEVIHISMSSGSNISAYERAVTAAAGFDHVHVIDSGSVSCGQGLLVLSAVPLVAEGKSVDAICEQLEKNKGQIACGFMTPGADLLYRNAYTKRPVASLSRGFQLHPVLKMKHSRLTVVGMRGGKLDAAWKRFIRQELRKKKHINKEVVYVTHVGLNAGQQDLLRREILKHIAFERVIIQNASVSFACNTGIGTIGLTYYLDEVEKL